MQNDSCAVCSTGVYPSFPSSKDLCEAHNVCVSCGIKRSQLDHAPWASRIGAFQCAPCEKTEKEARIKKRISKRFDHEYSDEVICPHCGYEHGDSWEMGEGDNECSECEKPFSMSRNVSVTYSTEKLEASHA